MYKRASLNQKFNGVAAAFFTKQANAASKIKDAINTPMAGLLAGAGLTGGFGLRAIDTLKNSVNRMGGELAALSSSTTEHQLANAKALKEVSEYLESALKNDAIKRDLFSKYKDLKADRAALMHKRWGPGISSDQAAHYDFQARDMDEALQALKDQLFLTH
jgi:hypothetical protein